MLRTWWRRIGGKVFDVGVIAAIVTAASNLGIEALKRPASGLAVKDRCEIAARVYGEGAINPDMDMTKAKSVADTAADVLASDCMRKTSR